MPRTVAVIGTSTAFRNVPPSAAHRGNAGNMLHAQAARALMQDCREYPSGRAWTDEELEWLRSEASHILYVAANGVHVGAETSALEPMQRTAADNIRRAGLPVVMLGLGAQYRGMNVPEDLVVPEGTRAFLRVASEHAESVGVRGAFTAEVLKRLGIGNAEVLGCQTCFMSHDRSFPDRIAEPAAGLGWHEVVSSYTNPRREQRLLALLYRNGVDVMGQEEFWEHALATGGAPDAFAALPRAERLRAALATLDIPLEAFTAYLADHFRQYEDLAVWREDVRRYRFACGTRFHGNMTALQSGVPALWISHDSRTRELCNHLGLPSIPLNQVREDMPLDELAARADYGAFRRVYLRNYERLRAHLDRSGVAHRLT